MELFRVLRIILLDCAIIVFVRKVAWPHFNYKYSYKNIFVALYKQDSSLAVLTGGNRGLGLRVLKKLLECEMTVILGKVRHTLKIVIKIIVFKV